MKINKIGVYIQTIESIINNYNLFTDEIKKNDNLYNLTYTILIPLFNCKYEKTKHKVKKVETYTVDHVIVSIDRTINSNNECLKLNTFIEELYFSCSKVAKVPGLTILISEQQIKYF